MNPSSSETLKSLETILYGMWRAFVLTCGLLWIFIFYLFVFLWENSHVPIDLWNSAFLESIKDDNVKVLIDSVCELMESAGGDRVYVKGHRLHHWNGDLNAKFHNVDDTPEHVCQDQGTKFKDQEVRRRDGIIKEHSVVPVRPFPPLPANLDDHSNHHPYASKLQLSFTLAPNPEVKGQHVKAQKSKDWEICIEESCVQVVKTPKSLEVNNNVINYDNLKQHEGCSLLASSSKNSNREGTEEVNI